MFATLQGQPDVRVLRLHLRRVDTEHAEVLALYIIERVAKELEKVGVGGQDVAIQAVVNDGHGPVDGGDRSFELCVARLGLGVVDQYPVNPARLALVVIDTATAFGHPAQTAVAVAQPVFVGVGQARFQCFTDRAVQTGNICLYQQVLHALGLGHQGFGWPARQGLDRGAQEQGLPGRMGCAAERDARNIADQCAQLLFALAQRLFHGVALAHVRQKAHKQGLIGHGGTAHRQPHLNQIAVLVQSVYFPAGTDDAGVTGCQVVLQVTIVCLLVGCRHQGVDIAANHFFGLPAQQALCSRIEGSNAAIAFNHDNAVHRGINHSLQACFTALNLRKHLTPAQGNMTDQDEQAHQQTNGSGGGEQRPGAIQRHGA